MTSPAFLLDRGLTQYFQKQSDITDPKQQSLIIDHSENVKSFMDQSNSIKDKSDLTDLASIDPVIKPKEVE